MDNVMAVAIYIFIWWIVLFAVLPFGVHTQDEAGSVVPGTPGSAPAKRAHRAHLPHQHGGGDASSSRSFMGRSSTKSSRRRRFPGERAQRAHKRAKSKVH